MAWDAGSIESSLDVDLSPFRRGLDQAKSEARRFQREKFSATVDADTTKAEAKILRFEEHVKRAAGKTNVELALDNAAATRKLVTFSERLDAMRAKVSTARVAADTDDAKARLDALDIQLRRVGLITSRPKVSVEGVERANLQLDALALKLAAVNRGGTGGGRGSGGGSGGFLSRFAGANVPNPSAMALGIGAALPAAIPFGGLAAGAAGGALSATVTGGLGLGAFAAGAKASLTTITGDITKLNKLTGQYNAATTNKQRAAVLQKEQALWKSLDPAQRAAVKNVQHLDSAWASYKKKLEPQTFAVVADGSKIAATGLKYLLPTAQAVGDELDILAKHAEKAFKAPFWHDFFGNFLPGEAARSVDTLGRVLGNMGTGLAHLTVQFAPLAHDLENALVGGSGKFEKWTQGSGPAKFVAWAEKEGPVAAKALEGLGKGVEGLAKGFAPIGQLELKALTPVLNFLGKLGDEHPEVITAVGGALLTLGAGLKAVNIAQGAAGVLGKIPGLKGLGAGGGGRGGTPADPLYVLDVTKDGGAGLPGGGKGKKGPGNLPMLGIPLTAAYLATQGGDQNPAQKNAVIGGQVAQALADAIHAINTRSGFDLAKAPGAQKDLYASAFSGGGGSTKVNVPNAVAYLQQFGSPAQVKALAAAYPQVAAAVKDAARQESVLNHYLAVNTGLSAANAAAQARTSAAIRRAFLGIPSWVRTAEAAAASGGVVIGKNLADGITIGLQQGNGKVQITAVQVVKGALHAMSRTAVTNSPSKVTTQYGRWIAEGLAVGFGQQMPQVEALFAKHTAGALGKIRALAQSRLDSARQQLAADQQNRAGYADTLSGNLTSGSNLTGAISSNGAVGNLSGYLGAYANRLGVFSTDIARLRKSGLAPALLQQIADAGPQQGVALAQSILSGASGSIKTLNANYSKITALSGSIGGNVANAVYGATITHDKAAVTELQKVSKALTELIKLSKSNPHAVAAAMQQIAVAGHAQTKVTPKR